MRRTPNYTKRQIENMIANVVRNYRVTDQYFVICFWMTVLVISVEVGFFSLVMLGKI